MLKSTTTNYHQADILHQIATPLTSIMLNLEDLHESQKGVNHQLDRSIQEMNRIFSVLQTRDAQTHTATTFCPARLIKDFLSNYQKPYQVKCTFRTAKRNSHISFYGCPNVFLEIVMHLLNNAAEAYCSHLVNREIFIDLVPAMSGLNLVIGDNGRGIDLFQQPFVTIKGISFKTIKSGLGLYKVEQLVRTHFGGKLKIISFPQRGTIIIVHFPLR